MTSSSNLHKACQLKATLSALMQEHYIMLLREQILAAQNSLGTAYRSHPGVLMSGDLYLQAVYQHNNQQAI